MANQLKMAIVQSIQQLYALGWSQRRIARQLGIDRGTVKRHLDLLRNATDSISKPAKAPTGSEGSKPATLVPSPGLAEFGSGVAGFETSEAPTGSESLGLAPAVDVVGANVTIGPSACLGLPGERSTCSAHRELILAKVEQGLNAARIRQDLQDELGVTVSYYSVRRFVQKVNATQPVPFRRMECGAGEEAQVDFGTGAPLVGPDGKRRKTNVFRIVLSHSRKGYSEATLTQSSEDFFRCLENAFAHFGGVPKTLVVDNLKAAVAHPDWFDPVLSPKVQSFCQHYGTTILPTKPYMARHKGKVEAGVKYVQNNALKGRSFATLEQQNQFLRDWESNTADTRIHGTTKKQVGKLFLEVEKVVLLPTPLERFAFFHEAQRKVSRDGHVEVAKAFYSAPPEYLGRTVWVRWDARLVRIFNQRFEPIAIHTRHEQGRFSTQPSHVAKEKISGLEKGASYLLQKASVIGEQTRQWSEAMLVARGIQGTRVLQGLLALTRKHGSETLEKACEIALSHGCYRLQSLRQLLQRQPDKQETFAFLDEHPLIRPLDDYAAVVAQALQRQEDRSSLSEGFRRHDWTETSGSLAQEKSLLASRPTPAGFADLSPPRPSYPSSGCASAEPNTVSPGNPTLVPDVRSSNSSETSHE
jgi:transposase